MECIILFAVIIGLILYLFSFRKNFKTGIDTKVIYDDVSRLAGILDLSVYQPERVRFKFSALLNSIEGRQPVFKALSRNYVLESLLFFQHEVMQELRTAVNTKTVYTEEEAKLRSTFAFNWLPESIKKELEASNKMKEYSDPLFYVNGESKLLILTDKVLLYALINR